MFRFKLCSWRTVFKVMLIVHIFCFSLVNAYLVIINQDVPPGTIIFNASVYKLGSERHYKLNTHKSAHFVHHLMQVNAKNGQIKLQKHLECNGIFYPNLFTFYIDSTSTQLRSIDYYSLPLRIFISGNDCNHDRHIEMYGRRFEEDDKSYSRKRRSALLLYSNKSEVSFREPERTDTLFQSNDNVLELTTPQFEDGDIIMGSPELNEMRHKILKRKRRSKAIDESERTIQRRFAEAKQLISETYASYAIQTTDKWNQICLKKSQFINNLNAFLPKTICQTCKVHFFDVNDERFKIEPKSQDLVASKDVCLQEAMWRVIITFSIRCHSNNIIDSDHRLKIVYHHQEFNDTDIAKRVKRELRNQSPFFEQALYVSSVLEEQPAGAMVTTVRARDPEDSPVVYSMISLLDSRSQSLFKVDSRSGVITTSAGLDRELMDVHYFRVVATDDSFPPRSGTTTLQVNVLDCNDHSPTFEAEQFEASIRESATIGSTVITLRATDQDIGKNAEIEYAIENVSGGGTTTQDQDLQTFRIDAKTGVITTKSNLDREATEIYTIYITATDMAPLQSERKSATTSVVVKVLDDNDNYPQFSERTYTVQVNEDQWSDNKVVAHIHATDADQGNNAAIRYAIIGGNTQSQFSIDSMNGNVILVKPLDYESVRSYRLVIRAQDGGSPSRSNTTQLLVNVIDANDNAPRFYTSQFQEVVLESVPVGYNIIRVQAYDSDEGKNAEITYSIFERDENFPLSVDARTGWIQTTKQLDREEQSRFAFQVLAVDGGIPPKSASSSVIISVQDVNDNDPSFNPKYYETVIGEDQPPGTPVTTVIATDPDEDSRLHYEISAGNTRGRFAITSQNGKGLITIAQPLDYKQERRFILVVTATDSGGKADTATVNVNVTDANNFAPVFENAPYSASVFEDAPVGTTVLIVSATDSDVGINAQITYTLNDESVNGLGSQDPFKINSKTGAIVTSGLLDRETTSGYLLTVTAKDGGNPSLSDTTDIEISVTDVNDNPPSFKVPLYQASVSEDALIGTPVVQISAFDPDMGLNGRIKYILSAKDVEDGSFAVDPTSGTIRTNKGLDRESVPTYYLTALAVDKGSPPLSTSVEVQVRLEDVNDSPPTFESDKLVLYIAENSPVGSVVGEIHAYDPDEGVNAIVHYSIIGGDDSNAFSLVTRPGSDRAQLLTMTELDYESNRKKFELTVRAASPPLRNDVHVDILVTDVNDNAPVLRNFQVIFNNFRDHFPSGEIGKVPGFDADITDNLTFKILNGNNANLVKLNTSSGGLVLSPQLNTNVPKFAAMEVSVSDGINEAKAVMHLWVRLITEEMLFNSVTIRLNEMTEEAFLSPLLNFFLDGLAAIIPCPKENIFIFSIQEDTDVNLRILNVSFSARRPDISHEEYYTPQYLQEKVYLNRAILARLATVEVLPFDDNLCVREPCLNFEKCLSVLKFGNASDFIYSDTVLFRPIYPVNTFACECPEGFTGSKEHYLCDTEVDLCYSNPCKNNGKCQRREGGYSCVCPPDFTGINCESKIDTLKPCVEDLCQDGVQCIRNYPNIDHPPYYTATCELRTRSFSKNSFLTFESLKQRHRFHIELKFASVNEYGLLFYNGRYNEQHDFVALEILDGQILFSFSLGDSIKSVGIQRSQKVSDGQWHKIEVIYFNRSATLVLDDCDTAVSLSGKSFGDKWRCANKTTLVLEKKCVSLTETCHRFLDLTGPLQIGGLPKISANFPVQTQDFVGCISDLKIDGRSVDLNAFVADNGTLSGCPQKSSQCSSEPCFNGGVCKEGWNTHNCECPEGFTGNACQESVPLPWRFAGEGVLSFNPLLRPIQLPWFTGLSLRTWQHNAFLMQIQIGQNSSIVLFLKQGMLYYVYDADPIFLTGANLADGNWHRVDIKWLGSEINISVDYGQRNSVISIVQKIQGFYVGKIVVGSPDGSMGHLSDFKNFDGCIQDVRIGGSQSILNRPTIRENVQDGCASRAKCPTQCPAHSHCSTKWDEADCSCLNGFVGEDCAPICTVSPCTAGQCRADDREQKGYRCQCNSTMQSGEYCEINVQQPCPAGWWGEKVCGPCQCNLQEGYDPDCNKTTGQCYCKDNHYQPKNETTCFACDCYSIGSFSGECNKLTGQCECRDGVIGRRCDSCSNPYAEVTLTGCEVIYDACPKSFSAGIWWPRTALGNVAVENCPSPAHGKGARRCDSKSGNWGTADMFNCTSEPFVELRKQLSQLENESLQLNSFISVKMAQNLRKACAIVDNKGSDKKDIKTGKRRYKKEFLFANNEFNPIWSHELEIGYLSDSVKFNHDKLYGADLLVTEGILHELINYEVMQNGLNLSHSQDKDFIKNLIFAAGTILDKKYNLEWKRAVELIQRGPVDLIGSFNKYMVTLAQTQHDTYTNPFEITHQNMVLGLDIITSESLFGYEPEQLSEYHKVKYAKPNQFTTEKIILPDTRGFLQHSSKQKAVISFPKYNNYLLDKSKFDTITKVLIPLDMLGIRPPEKHSFTQTRSNEYRAIISYAQYKHGGKLFPENFDDTITRRWGVDIQIVSPILSLSIFIPSDASKSDAKKAFSLANDSKLRVDSDNMKNIKNIEFNALDENIKIMAHDIETESAESFAAPDIKIRINENNFKIDESFFEPTGQIDDESSSIEKEQASVETGKVDLMNFGKTDSTKAALVKRQINDNYVYVDTQVENNTEQHTIYRSLGAPHLSQPITLKMWLDIDPYRFGVRSNPQCVRWNSFTNQWTRLGCQTEIPNYEEYNFGQPITVNCSCIHVSNYAVLVDVIDPEDIPEPSLLVQITSFSSFMVSLPILLSVLIALALLRGMQTNSNTIHQNIVLCVFFAELLYFVGMQSRRSLIEKEFPCKLVAICLHYFWLGVFSWTTVDCVHLYRMLTEMRDINHGPMGFYFAMGYGAPAIVVGLSVGVRAHEYGNSLFCWLSVYEPVVWWLVGPIAGMSVINLLILFVSLKAAFTLKDHVLGFGNLRTLLWLSVVGLPLMGVMWVLAVLSASDNSQLLSILLSSVVLLHAIFCMIGYCVINKRVRENLHRTFLRCIGRKVPLLDSSLAASNSSHNVTSKNVNANMSYGNNFLASNYDTTRRNIGISASSTTSRSTAKTSSSPYRSDGQLRNTSTSTSNYNSGSEAPHFNHRTYGESKKQNEEKRRHRKDSDSGSETDGRSLDLASSHSSDDDESRVARKNTNITENSGTLRSSAFTTTPNYLPNITEHVQATTPPELNVVQSPQLFPPVNRAVYAQRWSSQLPRAFLSQNISDEDGMQPQDKSANLFTGNITRWSQETESDNEINSHKIMSPNPLPNPNLTDTTYSNQQQSKISLTPSILENIQNICNDNNSSVFEQEKDQYKGEMNKNNRRKDYFDKYGQSYESPNLNRCTNAQTNTLNSNKYNYQPSHFESEKNNMSNSTRNFGSIEDKHMINHLRAYQTVENPLMFAKQNTVDYFGINDQSFYLTNDGLPREDIYNISAESPYVLKQSTIAYEDPILKNDYQHQSQQRSLDNQSDRMSEGSDKNGYLFPFTAEEDHITTGVFQKASAIRNHNSKVNDINKQGLAKDTPPLNINTMQSIAPSPSLSDSSRKNIEDDETTV